MKRTILITGTSSGIGLGLAKHYLVAGDRVSGISRRPAPLDEFVDYQHYQADLTDAAAVTRAVTELVAGNSRLDLVVLNAGKLTPIADMRETSIDLLRSAMDINVWSCKLLLDAVDRLGVEISQVVAISSGAAIRGNRGWNGYAISKAALNMLIQLYASEMTETHFSAIAPGLVDTAMQDYLCGLPPDSQYPSLESLRTRRNTAEMPRPDEIAGRLAEIFIRAPRLTPSGGFLDIRTITPEAGLS